MHSSLKILAFFASIIVCAKCADNVELVKYAAEFMNNANQYLSEFADADQNINWMTEVNGINQENLKLNIKLAADLKAYIKDLNEVLLKIDVDIIEDHNLRRQLKKIPILGYDVLDTEDKSELANVTSAMTEIYKTVNLCSYHDQNICNLTLIPHVQDIIQTTNDIREIEYYWLEWRSKTGSSIRDKFQRFIELYRKVTLLNGYETPSDYWFRGLEEDSDVIKADLEIVMTSLNPILTEIHAFIRNIMLNKYGSEIISSTGPYPSHLSEIFIGRAFRMSDLSSIEFPYPEKSLYNITSKMPNVGLVSTKDLFVFVDEYFSSLGFTGFSENYWLQYTAPKHNADETHLICFNRVFKFHSLPENKMSYCPQIDQTRFYSMFETIAQLHYSRSYKEQPFIYQDELFPNFNDALEKLFSLAASSPRYLERIGLITKEETDYEYRINRLYLMALQNVFVLPIFHILDKYRVDLLDGKVDINDNCAYWDLVERYIGAAAPFPRTSSDFDAPSKLLVGVDDEYSTQIVGTVIQFHLFKILCENSGQYVKGDPTKPLDMCDLYGEKEVFDRLRTLMKSGSSKTWREILLEVTGEIELNPDGFLEYFEPLNQWVKEHNSVNKVIVGWTSSSRCQR